MPDDSSEYNSDIAVNVVEVRCPFAEPKYDVIGCLPLRRHGINSVGSSNLSQSVSLRKGHYAAVNAWLRSIGTRSLHGPQSKLSPPIIDKEIFGVNASASTSYSAFFSSENISDSTRIGVNC